jgi:hypothetical protein
MHKSAQNLFLKLVTRDWIAAEGITFSSMKGKCLSIITIEDLQALDLKRDRTLHQVATYHVQTYAQYFVKKRNN